MDLFQQGDFTLHSGRQSRWKIECDALSDGDIETLALMLTEVVPPFGWVLGVPRGGLRLAKALDRYVTEDAPLMLVDDVLTTGGSLMEMWSKAPEGSFAAVVFARGNTPGFVHALFQMPLLVPSPTAADIWEGIDEPR